MLRCGSICDLLIFRNGVLPRKQENAISVTAVRSDVHRAPYITSRHDGSNLDGFNGFHDNRDDYDECDSASVDYDRTSSRTSDFDWGRRGSA